MRIDQIGAIRRQVTSPVNFGLPGRDRLVRIHVQHKSAILDDFLVVKGPILEHRVEPEVGIQERSATALCSGNLIGTGPISIWQEVVPMNLHGHRVLPRS